MQNNSNEPEFSPQQSLQLIRSMIETTKNTISNQSHYFLLWGWAVMIGCLLQYYLKVIAGYPQYHLAWLITPVALAIHFLLAYRDAKQIRVRTFINEANAYLWTGIGLSFFVLAFVFIKIGWQYCFPFYIAFYGMGTFVSGGLIKFKPMIIGGLLCFPLVIVAAFSGYDTQTLLTALAVFISYIIPGHILRYRYQKQSIQSTML
ncbi:hypothetical protein FC093_11865 [Ilyomonas limi]|uniref:Uncharacterized protein n=1 Tax=Ilyomonas limi TaxID=2575867 RepID=A0A4U3L0Q7_9BACT|nr:hypothetical protein [Ilyomonas limi]TKK68322.1 hypothetical protein FC093_11865 [Ilyomonas limi]